MKIIEFFMGGWVRWLVLAIVLGLGVTALRVHWVQVGREQVLRENIKVATKIVSQQGAATEKVVTQYVKVKGKTEVVTEYVDREVKVYEETNTGLCLDADWRRLHDSAATNQVPSSRRATDGEGGAPTAAAAERTVTENYARCNRTADRLDALQNWVRTQEAITK